MNEQINHHDPYAPLVRRASAPAQQTRAYRQSVGTNAGLHREDIPSTTTEQTPKRTGYDGVPLKLGRRPPVSAEEDDVLEEEEEAYDDAWPTRLPSSARRYVQPLSGARYQAHADHIIPRRQGQANRAKPPNVIYAGAAAADQPTQVQHHQRSFLRRAHPLFWLGIGMLLMLAAWVGWQALSSWWVIHLDDATYGRPRTYQVDAVVGHNDSPSHPSHFVAFNIDARVVILEIPGGDTSKALLYQGPQIFGTNADLDPVTLTFRDVNHTGKPLMMVNVQGAHLLYLNQNGKFVPQPTH